MKTLFRLIFVGVSLSLCLSAFSADNISKVTYKWIDEKGIIQYTERPPAKSAYEKITVTASGGQEVTTVTAEEATEDTEKTSNTMLDEVVQANERNCSIATQNMIVLTTKNRIRVSDDKGANRILTPEEKQDRIDATQKQIDIYCNKTN